VSVDVRIEGEDCRFLLRLADWQYPEIVSGPDANWVDGEVELLAGTRGRFTGRCGITILTDELADFCSELTVLLETLSGRATLEHLEERFGVAVSLKNGVGEAEVFVRENVGAELRVSAVPVDQPGLARTLRELRRAVAMFPVRGSAY
jgi:hypothetical protein